MRKIKALLLLFLCSGALIAQDQKPAFWNDIQAFKKTDSLSFPPKNAILFVGSSSFTRWTDVQQYFPSHPIINRGFGGSTLVDVIRFADDIIFPYQPKQIVIYCGENDIASSDTVTAKMALDRFKTLFQLIRSKLPDVPILFVSFKPSPSRWEMRDRMTRANELIRKFLKKNKNTVFVNVWNPMLGQDKKPEQEFFVEDNLHMTARGYAIWQKLIEPHLLN
ncbi:GDSL-type esterase/lipase family protein [Terrimonas pollutisoli]|uniref:GDSL-type esterase/lipase family protein n=1 Tax=Terrimonas pollutisoli TaxID=3034147 RepID=UPI0023EB2835|nr:GDSL-type esterase/lipase family protein [Terrimonas sp. H1YJ31]